MQQSKFRKQAEALLKEGRKKLDMTLGIVSRVYDDQYEIMAVSSLTKVFVAGEAFALRDTYCRDVVAQATTIALTEIDGRPGLQKHPLYDTLPLEAYISAPLIYEGGTSEKSVWGTINFSTMKLRNKPFSAEEIAFVENAAEQLSDSLKALWPW